MSPDPLLSGGVWVRLCIAHLKLIEPAVLNTLTEQWKIANMSSGGPEVDRPVRYSGKITADKLAWVVVHHTIDNQFVLILK